MRALTVGTMYPPHHLGGYELVWRSAVGHLREAGHEVRVLCTDHRESTQEPDEPGVFRELRWYWRDHAFPRLTLRERVALERHDARVLDAHLEAFAPDVVAWWAMGGLPLGLLERVRRRGVPRVAFVSDDWLNYGPRVDAWARAFRGRRRVLAPLAERLAGVPARVDLAGAARYVFVSEAMRALAPPVADSTIAHTGVEDALLARRAAERPWGWRLLQVGRIDERKGIGIALEALARLPAPARLTVAGEGDRREGERLRRRAAELGVDQRVAWLGTVARAELPGLYADHDVVLFPVLWEEPWGLVPLEAMAVGRPVVATGRGGSGEYLRDAENCLLSPAGDPDALAGAVRRLAAKPEQRARLVAGGRLTAERFTARAFDQRVREELERASLRR